MNDYQVKYTEIKETLALVMQTNNSLKQQLANTYNELKEYEQLKDDWQTEVQKVQNRIDILEADNEYLQEQLQESEQLRQELKDLQRYISEQDHEQKLKLNEYEQKLKQQEAHHRNALHEYENQLKDQEHQHKRQILEFEKLLKDKESANMNQLYENEKKLALTLKDQEYAFNNKTRDLEQVKVQLELTYQNKIREFEEKIEKSTKQQVKFQDQEGHFAKELDQARKQFQQEIEKLSMIVDSYSEENHKVNEHLKMAQDGIYELREALVQKEIQLKQYRDEWHHQIDAQQQLHCEELKKLQNIIENQTVLIQSYERVIEIETKQESQPKNTINTIQLEDSILELQNRNILLNNKIHELNIKSEQMTHMHSEEVLKLQSIVDDQRSLIHQYERMKERDQKQIEKVQHAYQNEYKEQVNDLTSIINQEKQSNQNLRQQLKDVQQQLEQAQQLNISYMQTINQQTTPVQQQQQQPFQYSIQQSYQQQAPYKQDFTFQSHPVLQQKTVSANVNQPVQPKVQKKKKEEHPRTFFTNNKSLIPQKTDDHPVKAVKRSFHTYTENDDTHAEKQFEEEFYNKFKNVINRMEDKLGKIQSELQIGDQRARKS